MNKIDTEKMLRIYVVVSTVLLVILTSGLAYTISELNKVKSAENNTSQGVGDVQNSVRQLCEHANLGC